MNKRLGFKCLLIDGFILSIFGLLTRYLSQFLGNFAQIFIRMLIVCILILPYILFKKIPLFYRDRNITRFILLITSFPIYIILFTISVNTIKIANAFFFIFISSTIISFIIGKCFFKEHFDFQRKLVLFLLFIGLILFAYPFEFNEKLAIGMTTGLLSGIFWGISNATRKLYSNKIDNYLLIFYQFLTGSIIGLIITLIISDKVVIPHSLLPMLVIILYGFGNIVFPTLLNIGFKNFNLNLGSIVLASQLIFITILGIVILKEIPTLTEILASFFVAIAIVLSNFKIKS